MPGNILYSANIPGLRMEYSTLKPDFSDRVKYPGWLAIHLPRLPLEVLAQEDGLPLAVAERQGGRRRILLCNAAAAAAGVAPGQAPAAARALSGGLRILARNPRRERMALEELALWAGRFTSRVVLEWPHGLLLELAGSYRLFGGPGRLTDALERDLQRTGHLCHTALAPTPAAAMLLARAGRRERVTDLPGLPRALAPTALGLLPLSGEQRQDLRDLGIRTLGELLALPAAGLARRLGPEPAAWLERLLGRQPDPRPPFPFPDRFHQRLELPAEVSSRQALSFAAHRLLLALAGFLTARQAGCRRLCWSLGLGEGREQGFVLGLQLPERDPERLLELLRQRLERVRLAAPVREIGLRVEELEPLAGRPAGLFPETPARPDPGLPERLQARLGEGAVCGLEVVPDHRPERAWRRTEPGAGGCTEAGHRPWCGRPPWLLPAPRPLPVDGRGRPCLDGPLSLEGERERIETGWWDGRPVARDYFVARTASGARAWIYRELGGGGRWYLHGWY